MTFHELAAGAAGFDILGFLASIAALLVVYYVVFAVCLYKIAKRTKTENAFLAFIPIANVYLMVEIAQKPIWWLVVLLIVPIVNIIFAILTFMAIAKRMGRPAWWGVVIALLSGVIIGMIPLAILAFGKSRAPGVQ